MRSFLLAVLMITVSSTPFAIAGDDPSIPKSAKQAIQKSMQDHITALQDNKRYPIFDAGARKLVRLKLKKLHTGVVRKGSLYVSCADFLDEKGNVYDVDFLVHQGNGGYKVVEALVHSKNGVKSAYHVEH